MTLGKVCYYYILENYFLCVCARRIQVSVLVKARFMSVDPVFPCKGKGEVFHVLTKHHAITTVPCIHDLSAMWARVISFISNDFIPRKGTLSTH
jgi:hypothetical protein